MLAYPLTFVEGFVIVWAMHKLRLAIVGIGHLGSKHLKVLNDLRQEVEIVAICDLKEDSLHLLAEQYHVPFVKNYQELEGKIDCVSLCVPTTSHFEIAQFFLNHNIHTFIEKPMTSTIQEAEKLNEIAEKRKLILQIGHVERFNSAFQSIERFLQKPLFIECHRLNLFPNRSLDIGVVMDLMIHDIDIILGLVKSPIEKIEAIGANVLTRLEDIANARVTFQNGCICNLTASRVSDEVVRKIRIFQPDSYISLDYVKQEAFIYRKHDNQIHKHALPIDKEEPLKKELKHFIECIRENKTPIVSGKEGQEALAIALQVTEQILKNIDQICLSSI